MPEIVVLVAHPQQEHSRANRALMRAAAGHVAQRVAVRDLYALYPDYLVDVVAEQALLADARLVVWQHPIHWYGMPPLMKLWLDEVFAFGWAYGPGGDRLLGKDLWLVASTGGPQESYRPDGYNRYFFDAFLPPYEQTAALAGMRFLPPLLLHGAHRVTDEELQAHAAVFADRLGSYPDWPEIAELEPCAPCDVPSDSRPARRSEMAPPKLTSLAGPPPGGAQSTWERPGAD
jgi:glutathione-regulated potassium-efflux system ancillary protein KefF